MILKRERAIKEIFKRAPEVGVPYKGTEQKAPSRFYRYDPSLSQAIAGYRKGPKNPYIKELMEN